VTSVTRDVYAATYGPTQGDRVRLADSSLWVQVEGDDSSYGDEVVGGFGKTFREDALAPGRGSLSTLDLLISNVVLIDPVLGVRKTNIGIKDGVIIGAGRAGSRDVAENPDLLTGPHTGLIPGEGLIATPGAVDSHVHLSNANVLPNLLASGVTTIVGMGSGGVWDVGVNPSYSLPTMFAAWSGIPLNVALLGRGSRDVATLEAAVSLGVAGFKVHEDFGAAPQAIDATLSVATAADVAVALHTDSLNETASLSDTIEAIAGRAVHAYHVEGSGGGHVPDILEIVSNSAVLPSSTTPTVPYAVNTVDELMPMTMTVHRQAARLATDREKTRWRVRPATIQAESVLQDLGAISIVNSDSLGMGRAGEMIRRTWQLASRMKDLSGLDGGDHDNARVRRYIAKYTINPALVHGMAHLVGTLEPGKLADVVLWRPEYFGIKPEITVKSGFVAWGVSGSGAGATRLCEPLRYRPYFGATGDAPSRLSVAFVGGPAIDGLRRNDVARLRLEAVGGCRRVNKRAMVSNDATPPVVVAPDGQSVTVDGRQVHVPPATSLPMGQLFSLA
jgi:urease subunit alpha